MKESYIKLPNITVSKLQDVVDFLDDNNIEYIEEYKADEEIERLNNDIKILLQENSNKEKVIIKQDNIINEIEAIVYADISNIDCRISIQEKLDKLKELKKGGK